MILKGEGSTTHPGHLPSEGRGWWMRLDIEIAECLSWQWSYGESNLLIT